jgi:hypothetical protein
MRLFAVITWLALWPVATAYSQPTSRFELGPVARLDRVFLEGGASGGTGVAGVVASYRLWKTYGVEAEITGASNEVERSHEGWFISYAQGPNLTREEIERLAPVARRSLGYTHGLGWTTAFVARGEISPRVRIAGRAGISARRYTETSSYTILSMPEGVDPGRVARDFQDTSLNRTRGGLLLGVDASFAVTDRFNVAPELRFVYGGPARVGNNYRELGVGARGTWRF